MPASSYGFPPSPREDQFQPRAVLARENSMAPSLMERKSFSMDDISKELQSRNTEPRSFVELMVTPSVYVMCAGNTQASVYEDDVVTSDWFCCAMPEDRDTKEWISKVVEKLTSRQDSWSTLVTNDMYTKTKRAFERFRKSRDSHFGVTVQAAVPGTPLLSFPYVLHHIMDCKEQERRHGDFDIHHLRVLLIFLDFFTASEDSGGGAVGPRSMKVTVDEDFRLAINWQFKVHFGVKLASSIKKTFIMKLFQPIRDDAPVNDILEEILGREKYLDKQLLNLHKVLNPGSQQPPDVLRVHIVHIEKLFIAAAICLWVPNNQQERKILQTVTKLLSYAENHVAEAEAAILRGFKEKDNADSKFEMLGMELYECAVQNLLEFINTDKEGGASSSSKGKTITIIEVASCAPKGFLSQSHPSAPTHYPTPPNNFSISASVNEAIRYKLTHNVLNWRLKDHLKWEEHPCPSLEPDSEEYLRWVFDEYVFNQSDMRALFNEIERNPEARTFFKLEPNCDPQSFFEDPEGAELNTWDDFRDFYISKCCTDNVSLHSDEDAQWEKYAKKAYNDVIAPNGSLSSGGSPNAAGLDDRWIRVLKKSREDTHRKEKDYVRVTISNNREWRELAEGSGNLCWREYCKEKMSYREEDHLSHHEETTESFNAVIEMLGDCDDILFLKVAYAQKHQSNAIGCSSSVPLPAQLVMLDLPDLVQVWQKLFPMKVPLYKAASGDEDEGALAWAKQQLRDARLKEFEDFVHLHGSSTVCMSQAALSIWERFVTPRNLPPPPPVLGGRAAAEHRQDHTPLADDRQVDDARQLSQTGGQGRMGAALERLRGQSSSTESCVHQPVPHGTPPATPGVSRSSGVARSSRERSELLDDQENPFVLPHSRPPPEPALSTVPEPPQARLLHSPAPSVHSSESEEWTASRQHELNGHPPDVFQTRRSQNFSFSNDPAMQSQADTASGGISRNVELPGPTLLTNASKQQFLAGKPLVSSQVRGQRFAGLDDEKIFEDPEVQEFLLNQMPGRATEKTEKPDADGNLWKGEAAHEAPRNLLGILDPWGGCTVARLSEIDGLLRHYEDGFPDEDLSSVVKGDKSVVEGSEIQKLSASKYSHLLGAAGASGKLEPCICKDVHPRSMIQGRVGDCWLVAAVAALCEFEDTIRKVFVKCNVVQQGATGPYELVLHDPKRDFAAVPILINDEIPCFRQRIGWRPCFASTTSTDDKSIDLWPMLLEKGIAFLLGGYLKLNGNRAPLAWAIITGERQFHTYFPCDAKGDTWGEGGFTDLVHRPSRYSYKPKDPENTLPENMLQSERIWGALRLLDIDGKLMACTFKKCQDDQRNEDLGEADAGDGLLAGHAYSLITVKELRGTHRLLQLRNPWADAHEWSGKWSDSSAEWKAHREVADELNFGESNRKADGLFWMSWDDFRMRVADIVFSEASFAQKYGSRVTAAPPTDTLWSRQPASEIQSAGLPPSLPDLWHNLQDCDPDRLQEDLTSYFDGFSDQDFSVELKIFRSSEIRWVSASRVHKLLQYEQDAMPGDMSEEELVIHKRWAEIAEHSGASNAQDAKLCSRIDLHVMQAHRGNSWLTAAVASLARFHKPILDIFSPKCLHKGKDGPYQLSLHDPQQGWRKKSIKINDRVPCYAHYGNNRKRAAGWRPCYAAALYREVWPMLLEKGIASLLGGYDKLDGNPPQLAWAILTGDLRYTIYFPWADDSEMAWGEGACDLNTRTQQYKYQPKDLNHHATDWAWDKIKHAAKDGKLMACTFQSFDNVEPDVDFAEVGYKDGLAANHTYVVLFADSILEESGSTGRGAGRRGRGGGGRAADRNVEHRLLCLKSPWAGDIGWCGRWSFDSPEWEKHPKVANQLQRIQQENDFIQDGVFWMDWAQFQENVKEVIVSEKAYWRTPPPAPPKVEQAEDTSAEQVVLHHEEHQSDVAHQPGTGVHVRGTVDQAHGRDVSTPRSGDTLASQVAARPEGVHQPDCFMPADRSTYEEQPLVTHEAEDVHPHGNAADSEQQRRDTRFRSNPQSQRAQKSGDRTPTRSPSIQSRSGGAGTNAEDALRSLARPDPVEAICSPSNGPAASNFGRVNQPASNVSATGNVGRVDPPASSIPLASNFARGDQPAFSVPEISNLGRVDTWPHSNIPGTSPLLAEQNFSAPYDALRMGANPDYLNSEILPPSYTPADGGFGMADTPAQRYPVNSPVLYYDESMFGGPRWMPATVLHYSPFTGLYTLDCKENVDPNQLRSIHLHGDPLVSPAPPACSIGEAPGSFLPPIPFACKFCQRMMPLDATCCPGCGQRADRAPSDFLPRNPAPPPPPMQAPSHGSVCTNCGQTLLGDHQFCMKCGCRAPAFSQATPMFLPNTPSNFGHDGIFQRHASSETPQHEQARLLPSQQTSPQHEQAMLLPPPPMPQAPPQHEQATSLPPPPMPLPAPSPRQQASQLQGSQHGAQQDIQQERPLDSARVREIYRGLDEERRYREQEERRGNQFNATLAAQQAPGQRARGSTGSRSVDDMSDRSSETSVPISGHSNRDGRLPPPPAAPSRRASVNENQALQRSSMVGQVDNEDIRERNLRELESDQESERSEVFDGNGTNSDSEYEHQRRRPHHRSAARRHHQDRLENIVFFIGMRVERRVRADFDDGGVVRLEAGATGTVEELAPDGHPERVLVRWDAIGSQRAFSAVTRKDKVLPMDETGEILAHNEYGREIIVGHNEYRRDVVEQPDVHYGYEVVGGVTSGSGGGGQARAGNGPNSNNKTECALYAHFDVFDEQNFLQSGGRERFINSFKRAIAEYIQVNPDRVKVLRGVEQMTSHVRMDTPVLTNRYDPQALRNHGKTLHIEIPGTVLQSNSGPFALPIRKLREFQRLLHLIPVTHDPTGHHRNGQPEFWRNVRLLSPPKMCTCLFAKNVNPFMGSTLSGVVSQSCIYAHRFIVIGGPNQAQLTQPADRRTIPDNHKVALRDACRVVTDVTTGLGATAHGANLQVVPRSWNRVDRGVQDGPANGYGYKLEVEVTKVDVPDMTLNEVRQNMTWMELCNWRIDAAVHHEGTRFVNNGNGVRDHMRDHICAHVDIRREDAANGVYDDRRGRDEIRRQFESAIRRLAEERGIQDHLDLEVYGLHEKERTVEDREVTDMRGGRNNRDKSNRERRQAVWTVDFTLRRHAPQNVQWDRWVDMRQLQDLLWALNRDDTKAWARALPVNARHLDRQAREFFQHFSLHSGVRICANDLNTDSALAPIGPQCTFVSEIDIVDCKRFFETSGPLGFASMLSDALHFVAGIPAPRITILDAREQKREKVPNHDKAKRYSVYIEVGFPEENPATLPFLQVYDCMWHLHSEIIRNRWAHLPFFKHYIVEGGVQVDVPNNVRATVQSIDPHKSLPSVRAHVDIIDDNPSQPFLRGHNNSVRELATEFRYALATAVDIPQACVKVICIRKKPVHIGHSRLIKCMRDRVLHRSEASRSRDRDLHDTAIDDAARHELRQARDAPHDWNHVEALWGYTVEFEVFAPDTATSLQDRVEELKRSMKRLRKLHSVAVSRKYVPNHVQRHPVEFLRRYVFDMGVQIDFAAHPQDGPDEHDDHVEDNMYPLEDGPVSIYPSFKNLGDPLSLRDERVLIRAHLDIRNKTVDEGGINDNEHRDGAYHEEDIREWFRALLREHVLDPDQSNPRPPGNFVIVHVQKKAAHSHSLRSFYLARGDQGHDRARLQDTLTVGYTIHFELRCPRVVPRGNVVNMKTFVLNNLNYLRQLVYYSSPHAPSACEFFNYFVFDHGIMIDAFEQQGLATYSMSPVAIRASMTLARRGNSGSGNKAALEAAFPSALAAALGTCSTQINNVKVQDTTEHSTVNVDFEVKTLAPNPAKKEFDSLKIKLQALDFQSRTAGRWWAELFPGWRPVSVTTGEQVATRYEDDRDADPVRDACDSDEEHHAFQADHDHWVNNMRTDP